MTRPQSTAAWQAQRIEELEAEVAYLREQAAKDNDLAAVVSWRLQIAGRQARALACLLRARHGASTETLLHVVGISGEADETNLRVLISKLRRSLEARGLVNPIICRRTIGYRLSDPARAHVLAAIGQAQEMAR